MSPTARVTRNQLSLPSPNNLPRIVAVDLFCGAGGLTKGLLKAGVEVAVGVDLDPACAYAYEKNNKSKFLLKSVAEITSTELSGFFESQHYSLLAGCAPCQPFSKYRLGKSDETDGRWNLLTEFQRLVLEVQPDIVTMENVPRLAEQQIFLAFTASLEGAGYSVSTKVVKCAEYGVPQQRERLVMLASRLGPIALIPATHLVGKTVRKAIAGLPPIVAGEGHPKDALHVSAALSPLNMKRIKASIPGGTWRDWNDSLVADCHKKKSGKTYPSVYGRMVWDQPSPTMTTQFFGFGNGRFGHPEQDRGISLREGAILQSFPKSYQFAKPGSRIEFKTVGRLIGNAVPVKLGEAIGKSIVAHVEEIERSAAKTSGNAPELKRK
jgi:DNA (cytosine-5)-methyltransferase 1